MTDDIPAVRRPGPWEQAEAATTVEASGPAGPAAPRQSLIMALVSTALLAGWITYNMGWKWALAGVVGVFVHEFGHVLAMNALGCGPARIHIIPFLGGAAVPARRANTDFKDVLISLAGPVFGLVATIPFLLASDLTGDAGWSGGAFFIAIINLINLAPAPPLDGSKALGPVLSRVHPLLERIALLLVGVAAVMWGVQTHNYILAALIGLGTFAAFRRPVLRPWALPLSRLQWAGSILLYSVAVGACLLMLFYASDSGGSDRAMRFLGFHA